MLDALCHFKVSHRHTSGSALHAGNGSVTASRSVATAAAGLDVYCKALLHTNNLLSIFLKRLRTPSTLRASPATVFENRHPCTLAVKWQQCESFELCYQIPVLAAFQSEENHTSQLSAVPASTVSSTVR